MKKATKIPTPPPFFVMQEVKNTQEELESMDEDAYVQRIYQIIKDFEVLNERYDKCLDKIKIRRK